MHGISLNARFNSSELTLLGDAVTTFAFNIATSLLAFLQSVLLARWLGPSGKGTVDLLLMTPMLVFVLTNLGVGQAMTYYLGSRQMDLHRAYRRGLGFSLGLGLLPTLALAAPPVRRTIGSVLTGIDSVSFCIALAGLVFIHLSSNWNQILLALKRIKLALALQLTSRLLLLGGVCLLYYGGDLGSRAVAVLFLLTYMLASLLAFTVAPKRQPSACPGPGEGRSSVGNWTLVRFGLQTYAGNLTQYFNFRLDVYLVSFFLGTAAVGLYMAVVLVAEGIWFVTRALGYVLFPHTAAGSEDNSRLVASLAGFFFYASIVAAILLGLVSRPVVAYLFGQKFLAAVPTLLALLPGVAAFSVVHVLAGYLIGRGKAMLNTYVALLSLVLTVALDLILIPRLGILGAGAASSVAYVASALLTLWFFSRLSNVKLRTVFTPGSNQFGPMVSYARTKVQGLAGY